MLIELSIYVSVFQFSQSVFVYAEVYLTFVALKEQCISHQPTCESSIVLVSKLLPNCKINVSPIVFISPSMEPFCAVPIHISRHAAGAVCVEPHKCYVAGLPLMEPLCAVPIYISRHAAGAVCGHPFLYHFQRRLANFLILPFVNHLSMFLGHACSN